MRIVIPLSQHDAHLLPGFLKVLRHFGPYHGHTITFSPSISQRETALAAMDSIGGLCSSITMLDIDYTEIGVWPQGPNQHWAMTAYALHDSGNPLPWFWMENDCTPVSPWADALSNEWSLGRKPFCGKIVAHARYDAQGNMTINPEEKLMMGCGIYPHDLLALRSAVNMLKLHVAGQYPEGWDVHLGSWMESKGWTPTTLLADRWNTQNYRMEGGILVCDKAPTHLIGRDMSKEDVTGAVVIHGCKDGSLGKLVMSGRYPVADQSYAEHAAVSRASFVPIPAPLPVTSTADSGHLLRITMLEAENAELRRKLAAATVQGHRPSTESVEQVQKDAIAGGAPPNSDLLSKVDALVVGKRRIRLGDLAAKCGTKPKILEPVLLASGNFDIKTTFKWVERKEAA